MIPDLEVSVMLRLLHAPIAIAFLIPAALFAQPLGPVRNHASHDNRLSPGSLAEINGPFTDGDSSNQEMLVHLNRQPFGGAH